MPNQYNFISLIDRHKGIIYKISDMYTRNSEDRKDLEQEVIIQLWKSFDNYDDQYKWSTWMYRIALNVAISWYRKETRRKDTAPLPDSIIFITTNTESENNNEDIDRLHGFINQMSKLNKALIMLYLDDYTHEEIADILGLSKTNVGTKISRIKEKLKQQFLKVKS